MKSATKFCALLATMAFLNFLPAESHAQNGGWAEPNGEQDFQQNRYPEFKGLTNTAADQQKVRDVCSKYADSSQAISIPVVRCNAAAHVYMREGQKAVNAEIQQQADKAQAAAVLQGIAAEQQQQREAALQENERKTAILQYQEKQAATTAAQEQELRLADEKGREKDQEDAANQQAQEKWMYASWTFGTLGLIAATIILFVGAARNTFVVFYDLRDVGLTSMIFVSWLGGHLLAWMFGLILGDSLMHPVCIGLGWALAILFSISTLSRSVKHNNTVPLGIFVGLLKIFAVALVAVLALIGISNLSTGLEHMPKDMHPLEQMERLRHTKRSGVIFAVLAAGALLMLLNGERVKAKRG
jgi:hypothetical protein